MQVFNGSPADGNLQRGDELLSINNNDIRGGYLKTAEDLIRASGNNLTIVLRRQVSNSTHIYLFQLINSKFAVLTLDYDMHLACTVRNNLSNSPTPDTSH